MTLQVVRLADQTPVPWRNGGGATHALLTWPQDAGWRVRISVATIAQDGPFSAYAGVWRWFQVLDGAGVDLDVGGAVRRCLPGNPPLAFDGADAPGCRLIDGTTHDLNLMIERAAGHGGMAPAGIAALAPHRLRAVYCADAVILQRGDGVPLPLPAACLAWCADPHDPHDAADWLVHAGADVSGPRAWWLWFEPHPAAIGAGPPP